MDKLAKSNIVAPSKIAENKTLFEIETEAYDNEVLFHCSDNKHILYQIVVIKC